MNRLKQVINFIYQHPLAKRHKVKASYRFFSWQLSQLFYPHEVVVPFVGTTKLIAKKGLTGATGNIYTGLHEFADMGFLLHFLRKEDLFFDIGANVGSYTILASGCIAAKSVSFEPIPATFEWLKKNIELNHLNDVVLARNIGIGSSKNILYFTKAFDTVNHVVINPGSMNSEEMIKVPVEDLDTIVTKEGIPILIKIDVEGFETDVLNGMSQTLPSEDLKAIIIELNGSGARYAYDERLIHEQLMSHNFRPYDYDPFERRLDLLQNFGSHNTIYIRDIDFAKKRVKTADKIKLFSEEF